LAYSAFEIDRFAYTKLEIFSNKGTAIFDR